MHTPGLFQANQTELKSNLKIEVGEAFLVNCGQSALIES